MYKFYKSLFVNVYDGGYFCGLFLNPFLKPNKMLNTTINTLILKTFCEEFHYDLVPIKKIHYVCIK